MGTIQRTIHALSFGGGIQTTALALMLERGMTGHEKPEIGIFADTGADPDHVYQTVQWVGERVSYPIVTVSAGNLYEDTMNMIQGVAIPHRGHNSESKPESGYRTDLPLYGEGGGMVKRQCTTHYKVNAIRRALREYAAPSRPPKLRIIQYLGISIEEVHRIKPSGVAYIETAYPLIDAKLRRSDCVEWLDQEHPGHPAGKSSCHFCPYRSRRDWLEIRNRYPRLWERNLEIEQALREQGRGLLLTRYRGGLERMARDHDMQGHLFEEGPDGWGNECTGHCGV